jgi:hypothetical protein
VYLAGGITLALAAGAGVTGVAYLQKKSDLQEMIDSGRGSQDEQQDRNDSAKRYGYVNLGLWVATAVGAGVTTYLYVTRPTQQSALRFTPYVGPQVAGLGVSGGF